jgi:hypothetical protein
MVNVSLTRNELNAIMRLILENQNSGKLQSLTNLSYIESINLRNKLYKRSW